MISATGRGRARPLGRQSQRLPRGARRPDDQIVAVDRDQPAAGLVHARRDQDTRVGEGKAEGLGLDAPRRVLSRERDQPGKRFGEVGPARRHVESGREARLMVEDRRRGAAQVGVAGEEVLVTMDADRSLVDDAGPDAVGSLGRLAPDRAGPQPPVPERRIVGHRAATVDGHTFVVGQQDAASNATDGLVQPVQACLGGTDQRRDPFARELEFAFGEPSRRPALGRVEPVQHRGSPPGSGQRGSRGRVAVNRRVDPIGVADRIPTAHPPLPVGGGHSDRLVIPMPESGCIVY